ARPRGARCGPDASRACGAPSASTSRPVHPGDALRVRGGADLARVADRARRVALTVGLVVVAHPEAEQQRGRCTAAQRAPARALERLEVTRLGCWPALRPAETDGDAVRACRRQTVERVGGA